ncbi:preprotein translocase subunit YajC [Hoylesella buccalis]|uniref:preprotein translocase subunit YajC n=1 Tax=Hoylesella buccalis TaxID=28127 RepID=UPI00288BDBFB|nr:preprotein translocase subunit YajC [Hoylesella buccalis]
MTTLLLAAQAAGGGTGMLIFMVAMLAIMWLFMIRPQQKKQKEIRNFQNALQEGSKVIINGGIYGVVKRIDLTTNKVDVEIARGVTVQVDRNFLYADVASQNTTNA